MALWLTLAWITSIHISIHFSRLRGPYEPVLDQIHFVWRSWVPGKDAVGPGLHFQDHCLDFIIIVDLDVSTVLEDSVLHQIVLSPFLKLWKYGVLACTHQLKWVFILIVKMSDCYNDFMIFNGIIPGFLEPRCADWKWWCCLQDFDRENTHLIPFISLFQMECVIIDRPFDIQHVHKGFGCFWVATGVQGQCIIFEMR